MTTTPTPVTEKPDPKLKHGADQIVHDVHGGLGDKAYDEIHQLYLDYRKGGGTDGAFWATMRQEGLTPQDEAYLSLRYAKTQWKNMAEGQSDGMDNNPSTGWMNAGSVNKFDAKLKSGVPEDDFEHHYDQVLAGVINNDNAFYSPMPFTANWMGPDDLETRLKAMGQQEAAAYPDLPPAPPEGPPPPVNGNDPAQDARKIMDVYQGLSEQTRKELFPDGQMTPKSVQDVLDDPNAHLSANQRELLMQLKDPSKWPEWMKGGAKLDDIASRLGETPNDVEAEIKRKNAEAGNALNALGNSLDPNNANGLFHDGKIEPKDIDERLKQIPDDEAHKAERAALQYLKDHFGDISSRGTEMTPDDVAAFAEKHGLAYNKETGKWEAKPDAAAQPALPEETKKAVDEKVDKIDSLPESVNLQPGVPIYKTITDQYIARAKITGEPMDKEHLRAYFLKVMKDSGFQLTKHEEEMFMRTGSPRYLPRAWNSHLTSHTQFNLFGNGERDHLREGIAASAPADQQAAMLAEIKRYEASKHPEPPT